MFAPLSFPRPLRLIALLVLLSTRLGTAAAPAPEGWEWAVAAGSTGHDKTRAITTDREGNVWIAGECSGPVRFGDLTLTHAGQMDCFVAKLDPQGRVLWARTAGGAGIDRAYGVATDAAGNGYVTGHYQSTNALFGGQTVPQRGDYDLFLAKYSAAGELQWVRTAGGPGYDYGHGVTVDPLGRVSVTGAVVGDATFTDQTFTNSRVAHLFCAQYRPDGGLAWVRTTTGRAASSGHGIAVDDQGNVVVGGYTGGAGEFGGILLTNARGRDLFVAKLNASGTVQWVAQGQGSTNAMAHEVAVDGAGNVWAAGMFKGSADLGDGPVISQGDSDWLLVHYDPTGRRRWSRHGGGTRVDYGLGVAAGAQGRVYLTGEFSETATVGPKTLVAQGGTDVYVAGFDDRGNLLHCWQAGGTKGDNAYVITRDRAGILYLAGSFNGTAAFGRHPLVSSGGNDLYVARLRPQ